MYQANNKSYNYKALHVLYIILYSHGSRQGVVCCMSGVVAPAGNMGLIEVKGTVAHEGPIERAIPTAWSKTVLHSPRTGGGGA